MKRRARKGLTVIARDFTTQPGIPLITVGPAQCVGGATAVTLTQGQFSADRAQEAAARPLAWHVPIEATAGGAVDTTRDRGRTTQSPSRAAGRCCSTRARTAITGRSIRRRRRRRLLARLTQLGPVDQSGLIAESGWRCR